MSKEKDGCRTSRQLWILLDVKRSGTLLFVFDQSYVGHHNKLRLMHLVIGDDVSTML